MFVARKTALIVAFFAASVAHAANEPRYIAGGGRQGFYWEAFLLSDESAGVGAIRDVKVSFITNEGQAREVELLANCNPGNPHVVDQDDRKTEISLSARPSQVEILPYSVWFASCRKQFGRFSKRGVDGRQQLTSSKLSFLVEGAEQIAKVQADSRLAPMRGLVRLVVGRATPAETMFVYCSDSVPTVHWPQNSKTVEISDADEEKQRKGQKLVGEALAVWRAVCVPPNSDPVRPPVEAPTLASPKASSGEKVASTVPSAPKPEKPSPSDSSEKPSSERVSKGAVEGEVNAVKTLYQSYMFRTKICNIVKEYADNPAELKRVMTEVDKIAKTRGIDTDKIWKEAERDLYDADFGPQLKMIESIDAMGGFSLPSDRRKAAPSCARQSALVRSAGEVILKAMGSESGAGQLKKDF